MIELPKPIEAYIVGSNAHDADACAACFAEDAIVRDEGREMRGVAAVRDWMNAAIAKYRHTLEVVSSAKTDGGAMVMCRVSGNFPGSPVELRHAFVLSGDKITRLVIVP
jgi:ketosteroid isomerase-like protein